MREQQPAQRDPAALAAGAASSTSASRRREPERVHRDLELTIEVPTAHGVDLVLQLGLLGEQLVEVGVGLAHRVAHLLEAVEETLGVRDTVGDVAEHVLALVELRLLREVADAEAGRHPHLAAVAVVLARR